MKICQGFKRIRMGITVDKWLCNMIFRGSGVRHFKYTLHTVLIYKIKDKYIKCNFNRLLFTTSSSACEQEKKDTLATRLQFLILMNYEDPFLQT